MVATVAPWALAAGVLVSFTASASNDAQGGTSASILSQAVSLGNAPLIPGSHVLAAPLVRLPGERPDPVQLASLRFDLPIGDAKMPRETPPRAEMKADAGSYPEIDRDHKSDPLVALRPSLSRRGLELRAEAGTPLARTVFGGDDEVVRPLEFAPGIPDGADAPSAMRLAPPLDDSPTATRLTSPVLSPGAAAAGSTGAGRGPGRLYAEGRTPGVARAAALSSATPAPADAVPVEVAAAPVSLPMTMRPGLSTVARGEAEAPPRYADLINPQNKERERRCLAEAVYFEARSEPAEGQAAVAQVVLNRVRSGLYPQSVCGVVYQNRHRHMACQFSFACEGKALRINDSESWDSAQRVANDVMDGKTYMSDVGGATHYHADYVRPRWAKRLEKKDVIGRHIFYQLKPGQT